MIVVVNAIAVVVVQRSGWKALGLRRDLTLGFVNGDISGYGHLHVERRDYDTKQSSQFTQEFAIRGTAKRGKAI
eukprot:2686814-Rhodomonas_salina.1